MKNVLKFALFAVITVINIFGGQQEDKMRRYEYRLKKLNEEKEKMRKEETSFINLLSESAQFAINLHICQWFAMVAFMESLLISSKNNCNPVNSFRNLAEKQVMFFVACDWTLKILAKPYKEHTRRKEILERDIENTSKKIEELKNLK